MRLRMRILLFMLIGLGSFPASVRAQQFAAPLPITARIDSILTFFSRGDVGTDYAAALARIYDPLARQSGVDMLRSLLAMASVNPIDRFRMTATLLHGWTHIPDSLRQRMQDIWSYAPVTLEAEHDEVIFHTSLLLSAERFPRAQRWFNGRSTDENIAYARTALIAWMDATVREGQQEFDSPTYGSLFITSMLLLRQFAAEAPMRTRADLMLQWLLADYFHEYQGGQFGGAHAREEMYSALQPMGSEMSALAWLYIGDGAQLYAREQIFAALSDFRPDSVLIRLATMKNQPFLAREVKRSQRRIRGDSVAVRPVVKQTWIDPLYMVGSMRGGLVQVREQHTWDITWSADGTSTTLFSMHPYAEAAAAAEFLPHAPERALRSIAVVDPFYKTMTKVTGGSPFEDVYQHRNTIVALYDVPMEVRSFPVMVGYLPLDVEAFDVDTAKSGWITINAGDVYLGVYPLRRGHLFDQGPARRIFSPAGRNGMIAFAVGRNAAGEYARFRDRVRKLTVDTSALESAARVRFTTIDGDRLECTFGRGMTVNGKAQAYETDMLFDSAWLSSKRGSGILTVTDARERLVIDWNAQTVRREAVARQRR